MHPTIHQQLAKARTADLLRQAERDRLAYAASRARRAQPRQRTRRVPGIVTVLARRVLALLAPVACGHHPHNPSKRRRPRHNRSASRAWRHEGQLMAWPIE